MSNLWVTRVLPRVGPAGEFDQGKYSMGLSLFPNNVNTFNSYTHVSP
jgi:hypothetical protein